MKPSLRMLSGGKAPLDTKHGEYLGPWGNLGSPVQKGITTYSISANRQRPLAGTLHAAVFNSWRRFRSQVLYWAPPMIVAYLAMQWAERRNEYLNSKAGRAAAAAQEAGAQIDNGTVRG